MSENARGEDKDSLRGGDLGLGRGLKPGGIPFVMDSSEKRWDLSQRNVNNPGATTPPFSYTCYSPDTDFQVRNLHNSCQTQSSQSGEPKCLLHNNLNEVASENFFDRISRPVVRKLSSIRRSNSRNSNSTQSEEESPPTEEEERILVFADVTLGTSIRQQKKLYEQQRKECVGSAVESESDKTTFQTMPSDRMTKTIETKDTNTKLDESGLLRNLRMAEREIELLRHELENTQQIAEARCKAIRLFKGQSYAVQSLQIDSAKKASKLNKTLQDEINRLQFEFEYQQAMVATSQEMWTTRFARISEENHTLTMTNQELSEKVRKLEAEKQALVRERDELLALVDVQERQKYESTRSLSSDDSQYSSFTSTELAILGACRCRINSPQPCGCAHAAAVTKREISKLRSELNNEHRRMDESVILADSYRIAFEEQLNRNSALTRRLVELTSFSLPYTKTVGKTRAALRWIIKQLNEEDYMPPHIQEAKEKENIALENVPVPSVEDAKDRPEDTDNIDISRTEINHDSSDAVDADEDTIESPIKRQGTGTKVKEKDKGIDNKTTNLFEDHKNNGIADQLQKMNDGLDDQSDVEMINMLIEMISERTEALAHQRLATRMLAKKLTEAEAKLAAFTEEIFDK